jgi:hypothetical protein
MYLKYLWYVLRHRWFVFLACCGRSIPWRGLAHDISKFRPSEFIPYARYFYGQQPASLPVKDAFDRAWLLHQHRNSHHWQFWVLREDDGDTKLLDMPWAFRYEMVCDWIGAGRAITGKTGTTPAWYEKNKERIRLSDVTRENVEEMLNGRDILRRIARIGS